ncbi:MAG: amidohydrolase family protein [Candidatus Izemoplasmatales bacterium]|nr:amidohydrolase family protein [Candidatus Izemoplasmatales bacterium]
MFDLALRNGLVWINHEFQATHIYVEHGRIALMTSDIFEAKRVVDCTNQWITPGVIDPHVHFDLDLGWTKSVDDFFDGSVSALFGGVTTVIDFLRPTSDAEDLEKSFQERLRESADCQTDVAFHATIKNPTGDIDAYVKKAKELGCVAIKLFTTYSDSGRRTYDDQIVSLLKASQKYQMLISCHVEADDQIVLSPNQTFHDLGRSRPASSETDEALKLAKMVRQHGGYLYMVHTSSGQTIRRLKTAYSDILHERFFIESCPQYFLFNETVWEQPNGALYTFAPPLRNESLRSELESLIGDVDTIGTDHCPFMKSQKFASTLKHTPLGIGGVEASFPIMVTRFGENILDRMTSNPARIHGLTHKGQLQIGFDADLVVWHKDSHSFIQRHSQSDYSIYDGIHVTPVIDQVYLRGELRVDGERWIQGHGRVLKGDHTR